MGIILTSYDAVSRKQVKRTMQIPQVHENMPQ